MNTGPGRELGLPKVECHCPNVAVLVEEHVDGEPSKTTPRFAGSDAQLAQAGDWLRRRTGGRRASRVAPVAVCKRPLVAGEHLKRGERADAAAEEVDVEDPLGRVP